MKRPAQSGFTLVELMVALLAGSIAVAGVFYLNGVTSRSYSEQMRVSEVQMSLRSAMDQLRRDFSRAGYLAAPSSATLADCSNSLGTTEVAPTAVEALRVLRNGSPVEARTLLSMTSSPPINLTRADRVVAMGNYATADVYVADPDRSTVNELFFQQDSESFRRSFVDARFDEQATVPDGERFVGAFADRMVRIENDGRVFFREVDDAVAATGSIKLKTALPWCFKLSTWTGVAPVMRVQYQLETDDSSDDLSRLQPPTLEGANVPVGQHRTLLVRRELDSAGAVVGGSSRVLLDYAVEFSVDAIVNSNFAAPTQAPVWALVNTAALDTTPSQAFRSLIVTLSSRSSDADPRLPFLPRTSLSNPLLTFRVATGSNYTANARVRTMRAEIFLQNL